MPITILEKKTRLPDLLAELFGTLGADERERATVAFMRANPQLGRRTNLRAGTVVIVPERGVPHPGGALSSDRVAHSAATLIDSTQQALADFAARLKAAVEAEREGLENATAVLRSRELREALHAPRLAEVAEAVAEAIKDRGKELEGSRRLLEDVLPKADKDLADLRERLG